MTARDRQRVIINPRNVTRASGPLLRRCPKCDAAPGHRCGKMDGFLGWVPMKSFHKGR